ncbi:rhodanese-like domain-containing protein [Sulfurospirillum sp. T05]|uniref:Rhodanese-like domain-containing protein n=1 Tax=Sulfurospirillum tamanense TaxID=2813362 RepID=A0ABS2WQB8_9BACT|nr:rhodanese-like domain-containing protein [Sulfurospirillum tamanensis]MBN2963820.1 rhodanese-like domain-containing protein [Sulfurospirillum tamanensis]
MRSTFVGALALTTALLFTGCATTSSTTSPAAAQAVLTKPSASVQKFIDQYKLEVVDYEYTRSKLGNGMRSGSKAVFIDSRPDRLYNAATIPSSIQIHDTDFKEHVVRIKDVPKDKEIIVFCQGWECAKSPKVAGWLKEMGYTNVKLYQAGYPEWVTKDYAEIGTGTIKAAFDKNGAFMIDARPYKMFLAETIPGAISMNDTEMPQLMGRFPVDKATPIITFCAGWECHKSHAVAQKLVSLGYTDVANYSAGLPAWKKAGLKTTKGSDEAAAGGAVTLSKPFLGPVKKGLDEGSVDGQWFLEVYKNLPADVTVVDARRSDERAAGAILGTVHVSLEENSTEEFLAKLPKKGYIIFHCAAGGRAMEAQMKAKNAGMTNAVFLDAGIKCAGSDCKITPNDPLDPMDW